LSKIEDSLAQEILIRAEIGLKKYGVTVERTDLTYNQWLQHLKEELMDSLVYLERIKSINIKHNVEHLLYIIDAIKGILIEYKDPENNMQHDECIRSINNIIFNTTATENINKFKKEIIK
jgi:hypothetical protein